MHRCWCTRRLAPPLKKYTRRIWLYEKTNHHQKYPAQPIRKEFVSGESLHYLGRTYQLHLTDDDAEGVHFQAGFYIAPRYRDAREWLREQGNVLEQDF